MKCLIFIPLLWQFLGSIAWGSTPPLSLGAVPVTADQAARVRANDAFGSSIVLVNSANYATTVSPGSIASVFGTDLSPTVVSANGLPLPTSLNGVQVWLNDQATGIFFVSPLQINVLVPNGLKPGSYPLRVTKADGSYVTGSFSVAEASPGIFTADDSGTGVPKAQAWDNERYDLIYDPETRAPLPISAGSDKHPNVLVLYGTGWAGFDKSKVQIKFNGIPATVTYSGPQNTYPGLDQLNVVIPPAVTNLSADPVQSSITLTVNNIKSNDVSMKLASTVCDLGAAPFGGGSGSATDPYLVCSRDHLDQVRNFSSSHFLQTQGIELYGAFLPFKPIAQFSGTYDGADFSIDDFYFSDPNGQDVGLFSNLTTGFSIANLRILNATVVGKTRVGILAGQLSSCGVISQVKVSGQVSGNQAVGGLVGAAVKICVTFTLPIIKNASSEALVNASDGIAGGLVGTVGGGWNVSFSHATGSVTGPATGGSGQIGGLVGSVTSGSIANCYSTGEVSGSGTLGGLVGLVSSQGGIARSYSFSQVSTFGSIVGGLVGENRGPIDTSFAAGIVGGATHAGGFAGVNSGVISNCYSRSILDNKSRPLIYGVYTGGFVGSNTLDIESSYSATPFIGNAPLTSPFEGGNNEFGQFASINHSYYQINATNGTDSIATPLTVPQMAIKSSFPGLNFGPVWVMPKANTMNPSYISKDLMPVLIWQCSLPGVTC